MAEFAYMNATNKIKPFLEKIQDVGVPPKVTQSWLASVGFTSTNDRNLIPLLKQIKFLDSTGKPTAYWERYRGGDHHVLAAGLREGYPTFYATYSDAHRRSSSELENIVKIGNSKINQETVRRVISTFKALVGEADFSENGAEQFVPPTPAGSGTNGVVPAPGASMVASARSLGAGLTINVNVQLTLPETTDGSVYEKLFAAMREHLLDGLTSAA